MSGSNSQDKSQELEKLIKSQKDIIGQLQQEQERLSTLSKHYKSLADDLNNQLSTIYNSNGWRFLSRYYKIRDSLQLLNITKRRQNKKNIKQSTTQPSEIVSIIIPVYNNAKYLRQCIESALNQNYEDLEVIVVDDCSTDPSVMPILESFKKNSRFRLYQNDFNSGISETMNHAMIRAKGDWIAFLDCDDWLEPDAIDKLMNCLMRKPGAVYGYSDRYNEYEKNGTSKIESFKMRPTENYFNELMIGMYTSHLKIIRKDVFLKIGLHESRFDGAQDYDIALKTAFHFGDAFAYCPEAIYHHRIHEKQTTLEAAKKIENIVNLIKSEARQRNEIRTGILDKFVSFVILSFEKKEMTLQCVEAIKKTVAVSHEIIIFDNASSEETVSYLKNNVESIEGVTVFYSNVNLGCPGGRRKATKLAKGDYIINLDNDIIVTDGWFEELIVRAEQSPQVGAVCCKTVFPNGKVQFNGGSYNVDDYFITFLLTDTEKDENSLDTAKWTNCDWVPGGATLFKKVIVDQIDYSEGYINAFEDNDVALQISRLNYKMLNCPTSKVYHYHIMHDSAQVNKEKEYMRVRYNTDGFVNSLLNFYNRNGLIINDPFVHRLMNVDGQSREVIRSKVLELASNKAPTLVK